MKKYLFIALAALGFAACAEKMDDNPTHHGEVESSYIAISLSATDPSTRAEGDEPQHEGTYQEGEAAERAVETAYFFFFNEDGSAFPVNVNADNTTSAPSTETEAKNYLLASLTTTTGADMNNVSDIKNVVLLLKSYKGDFPKKIVAVLNWVPTENTYSLSDLQGKLVDVRSNESDNLKGKFVMSNAVYAKDGSAVYATPLTPDNIFTDEVNAKANPVTIYVERVAAKVTVTTTGGNTVFNLNKPVTIGGSNTPVYAKILGWELYNDYHQSYLVKKIDPEWSNDEIGFTWNDSPWYRSYWAISQTEVFPNNTFSYQYASIPDGYKTVYGYGFGSETNVTAGKYADNSFTYCGENTERDVKDRTKIILKAQLVEKEDGTSPVELARWFSTEYLGEEDLRTAVANTLKYTLYYRDGDNYVGLKPEHLQCVSPEYRADGTISNGAPSTIKSYEVFFQLSSEGEKKTWYKNNGSEKHEISKDSSVDPHGVAAANEYLSLNVTPATLYKSGQTYYYFDVQHLGNLQDAVAQAGEYGIVRNHIYAININSIGGYGSPIYIGTSNIVTPPEYPDDPTGEETSFVSAEVRILSWRIVSHGVDIQPNPEPTPGV